MEQETVKTSLDQPKEKNRFVSVALVVLILALLGGITYAVLKKTSGNNLSGYEPVSRISKEEMELLMKEVNPMMLQKLAQDPEAKKELANNVQELFAIANQAKKEGLTNQENIKREMDNVRTEIIAINYDRTQNKDKEQAPPFSSITEEQVNQFWAATDGKTGFWDKIGLGENTAGKREQAFQKFLDAKVNLAKEGGQMPKDREISEEEMKQAKEYYAKTRIAAAEAEAKRGELGAEFWQKVELQTKLQQAQFLARTYAQKNLEERTKVTDEDVQKYLAEHPEINNTAEKKVKAEEILQRVKGGEDFAKLAKEFSEDPGSKDKGGLYEGITEGSFVPEFETVAFSLEPGQIAENLVESKFGYHIIKLEKKGETKGADGQAKRTFDARHILIQTGMKDPENPLSQPMPVNDFVKQKL
ncbi:MAG TPA: peptidylprolyl isomerase, partial [Pyrinomonadaceae bacterium]|nr:peptidylprolyl isomerase [Pyrinomonadaceae bacterium]